MAGIDVEQRSEGVCVLQLSNPERRNALTLGMIECLTYELARLAGDPTCRVVLLRGEGSHYCAGRDISDLDSPEKRQTEEIRIELRKLRDMAFALSRFPKPVVSVIRGYALGLGAALVALSDIAIATENARFGFPEAKIGIPPSLTAAILWRAVAPKAAMPLLLGGVTIDAREAERIGLVSKAAETEELEQETQAILAKLLQASPTAVALCKDLIRHSADLDFPRALDLAVETAFSGMATDDAVEGRCAFLEKRRPVW